MPILSSDSVGLHINLFFV